MLDDTYGDSELRRRNGDLIMLRNMRAVRSVPQRPRLQRRHAEPNLIPQAGATVTKSVVNVIIDDGTTAVAALTITDPTVANTISISNVGVLTFPPITTVPTKITTAVTESTPTSPVDTSSDSQTVLSSPPATPLESSSSKSLLAPAEKNNLTTSVFTSTGSHTTITGTTIIDLATVSFNRTSTRTSSKRTTLVTSTRHSSHSGSGASATGASASTSGSGWSLQTGAGTGIGGGATGTATAASSGSAASTSAAGGSGNSGGSQGPPTPTVVGGVVGGVAGFTVFLLLLLILLRWWKRKTRQRSVDEPSSAALPPSNTAPSQSQALAERPSSHTPLMSAISPAFLSRWRMSSHTASSSTTVPPAERGFQKVSGRKIDSVLTTGGDGYGDASSKETAPGSVPLPGLSGTSFYRDSAGFYGGPGQPSPRPSGQIQRDSGIPASIKDDESEIAVMRPSPARTPVTSEGGVSAGQFPNPPRPFGTTTPRSGTPPLTALSVVPSPLGPRDALGRSHPSLDGSRGSRFTESV
jgi:hypothetical protein